MTYQVLARKWRPKDFASLVGQEHVVRALTHALDAQRLHHAYLFTGTRGVGKTTLSRILAKALNCETGITATPCGVCTACREIDEGRFVDYVEMDAASNRGVDEMAALLERAVYAPVDARFKVYMIDEVHMLTNHAFNSMLKTLEEPPAHVKFILATTDPQKIPVTVLSRCLQFNLKQMPAGSIVSHLENILAQEGIAFETQALRLLSRAADGSMRDALSLTDQAIAYAAGEVTEQAVRGMLGALDQSYLVRLLDAVAARDGAAVLATADEMMSRSLSFSTALQDLSGLLHRIAWAQFAPASVLDEWPEAADIRRFAAQLSPEAVQLYYQIATIGRSELGLAPDEYAGFTMTLLRMLAFRAADGIGGSVLARTTPAGGTSGAGGAGHGGSQTRAPALPEATSAGAAAPAQSKVREPIDTPVGAADAAGAPVELAPVAVQSPSDSTMHDAQPASPGGDVAPRAAALRSASPASAALGVLRDKGMRLSSDRGRAPADAGGASRPVEGDVSATGSAANAVRPDGAPVAKSESARTATRLAERLAATGPRRAPAGAVSPGAAARSSPASAGDSVSASGHAEAPPWEEMAPDDAYMPLSAYDGSFEASAGDFAADSSAAFESPEAGNSTRTTLVQPVDTTPLPPAVSLAPVGFGDDWPALAASLPLTGIAYQLAFNSELTACEPGRLTLCVPVPQYADAAQVAKLKAALDAKLDAPVQLSVSVGPARRTAAAAQATARAQRQQEAEREIETDPFVRTLIREFDATIVPGSVRPLSGDHGAPAA
jgi:DNA polymerase III subunit gamma/tau